MKIFVLNSGSSSLKFQLFDMSKEDVLGKGVVERIGLPNSFLNFTNAKGEKFHFDINAKNHDQAIEYTFHLLTDDEAGIIKKLSEIDVVGHRVVHGGKTFNKSVIIDDHVLDAIKECTTLAPLHNPANLAGIKAIKRMMPRIPQVAVFDTAYHQTVPKEAFMYAIPYRCYQELDVRKYGFHGTSHQFVAMEAAHLLGKPLEELKLITCHLGNGGSVTAVKNGKSIDTSMGFTPTDGVVMGTRSGSVDPGAVLYVINHDQALINDAQKVLNKESGLLGISGVSSDMRDVMKAMDEGHERAKLAYDMFIYSVKKFIGAYAMAMGGLDAVVFTGGIGEHATRIRANILEGIEVFGGVVDEDKNNQLIGKVGSLASDSSKIELLVIPTNEELMIARDAMKLVK